MEWLTGISYGVSRSKEGVEVTAAEQPYWLGPEEGEAHWILGGLYTYKAIAEQVGGDYTAVEVIGPAGFGAPVHFHDDETEAFYVAEGSVTLFVGDAEIEAEPGSFIFAPPTFEHAFRFESPARMLLFFTRGTGHEGLFRSIGEPATSHTVPPPPEELPDVETMAATAARFGTRILGPPPS